MWEEAACRRFPIATVDAAFFPKRYSDTTAAIECCSMCPCRVDCLDLAMRNETGPTRFGVFGGRLPAERVTPRATPPIDG